MGTGTRKDNYTFYEGYEGEPEVIVSLPTASYHFWDGYFEDIFGDPDLSGKGWTGFTRDYNEMTNAFDDDCTQCTIMPDEYLADMEQYAGKMFTYQETKMVYEQLVSILKEAVESQLCVMVRVF